MRGDVQDRRSTHVLEEALCRIRARIHARLGQHLRQRVSLRRRTRQRIEAQSLLGVNGVHRLRERRRCRFFPAASNVGLATTIGGATSPRRVARRLRSRTKSRPLVTYEMVWPDEKFVVRTNQRGKRDEIQRSIG